MNTFLQELQIKTANFEEIFSDDFQILPGQKQDSDKSALRLAAWCRATASGDWSLFNKRLKRDGLSIENVISKFSTVKAQFSQTPEWLVDAQWIDEILQNPVDPTPLHSESNIFNSIPFHHLFAPLVKEASNQMLAKLDRDINPYLTQSGLHSLEFQLSKQLSDLSAPALFNRYIKYLKANLETVPPVSKEESEPSTALYSAFVKELQKSGIHQLFIDIPVLLRLIALVTRQWINTSSIFLQRLMNDFSELSHLYLENEKNPQINEIKGDLSDPHNFGFSVLILETLAGSKIVYKPKDLKLDVEWSALIEKLNLNNPSIKLKAARTSAKNGYGWTEFIIHQDCLSEEEFPLFFQRAGSLLALFHNFASGDMHYENIIACGSYPVPIDLEMILQATAPENELPAPEQKALNIANKKIVNSVLSVGMLPIYTRLTNNKIIDIGGLNGDVRSFSLGTWHNINTDAMRWSKEKKSEDYFPNIPHVGEHYAKLGDHLEHFITGFEQYSHFLLKVKDVQGVGYFLDSFKQLPVRKLIRPTRFYSMLMQRLKDYRNMGDGITWSVQADFLARLADWDNAQDIIWPLQQSERKALLNLNIPHFTTPSDGNEINDLEGYLASTDSISGIKRASDRFENLCNDEIAWQSQVIRLSTATVSHSDEDLADRYSINRSVPSAYLVENERTKLFLDTAQMVFDRILKNSYEMEESAAWIGIDWLGDSESAQLLPHSDDLYNGNAGIALFLSAYYHYSHDQRAKELAKKAMSVICHQMSQASAARWARNIGIGGASGLGSIVYSFTIIASLLDDPLYYEMAEKAAMLFTADLIAADESLDVIGGSAGAILGLLKLHRSTESKIALDAAIKCGEHLLGKARLGETGKRSWNPASSLSEKPLNGMSHGASGYAYALYCLAAVTTRSDFLDAADECIAYEKFHFDPEQNHWRDFRDEMANFLACQWCHGAIGIGLARIGISKVWGNYQEHFNEDLIIAQDAVTRAWPNKVDNLCCGTMGSIEFINELGKTRNEHELMNLAAERLESIIRAQHEDGEFKFYAGGNVDFNLGFFRGAAGIGYSALRQLDKELPNVLLWE